LWYCKITSLHLTLSCATFITWRDKTGRIN